MNAQPGARRGGVLRILRDAAYDHLDPQRSSTLQSVAIGHLLFRTLTMFAEDGSGGRVLVGDLAETPGRDVHGDGRVWEFVLRRGVRFEDGREITAADVAYGIARSFAEEISDGPTHLQTWLRENGDYEGPYADGGVEVPGLRVLDERTLHFAFRDPHPDLPFAATLSTTAPVPRDRDEGTGYGLRPVASGPYRIEQHRPGELLVLGRNPHWDPATDPVRHDHPDQVYVEMGIEAGPQNERVRKDSGEDAFAVAENTAPQVLADELTADPSLADRLRRDPTPLIWYLAVNTARLSDLRLRKAVAHAVDKAAVRDDMVGRGQGLVVHTLLPSATVGHRDYPDPHPLDPAAARALLDAAVRDGATPELRILHREGEYFAVPARVVAKNLDRIGFRTELVEIDRPSHNAVLKTRGHGYDLALMCMAGDWPGASTLLGMFDGRTIGPTGNDNFVYLDDPEVNAAIARIGGIPAERAAEAWADLDEQLLRDHAPMVPLFSYMHVALSGSRVGGVFTSSYLGTPVYYRAHLKGDPR
ncbi:ABC transporter substrate-binding protein [Streptomyces sp. NBC_00683]|uniref:ABC transporter substrate-binding protein n=1 Tax=Streptomyces sp. NBC_00683 TaxID=2903670 RepID=UPI002E34B466|nr:ABC transporter substrate-binding protein [Streptomyces sp. NBC_00683]